jgi:hypothetical protein
MVIQIKRALMNYFRYILLACVLVFSSMPVQAMEGSFFGSTFLRSCYGYTSSWISSSFLVTKEFVKRKISGVKNDLKHIIDLISKNKQEINKANENLDLAKKGQDENNAKLKEMATQNRLDQAAFIQRLQAVNTNQEKLASDLGIEKEKATELKKNTIVIAGELDTVVQSVKAQREKNIEDHKQFQKQLDDQHNNTLNQARGYFNYTELNAIKALAIADNERTDRIQKEMDKIEQQGEDFDKYSKEIERKINALHTTFVIKPSRLALLNNVPSKPEQSVLAPNASILSQSALTNISLLQKNVYKKSPELRAQSVAGLVNNKQSDDMYAEQID